METRTAWLEEHGIGACSGRGFHLARERRPRDNIPPSPTGTHSTARMLILIPVLFVSPSPIPPCCLSCPTLCPTLSWSSPPHPVSLCFYCLCLYLLCLFSLLSFSTVCTFSPCVCCVRDPPAPLPPLCQNGVYGASNRLHPRPEVHH